MVGAAEIRQAFARGVLNPTEFKRLSSGFSEGSISQEEISRVIAGGRERLRLVQESRARSEARQAEKKRIARLQKQIRSQTEKADKLGRSADTPSEIERVEDIRRQIRVKENQLDTILKRSQGQLTQAEQERALRTGEFSAREKREQAEEFKQKKELESRRATAKTLFPVTAAEGTELGDIQRSRREAFIQQEGGVGVLRRQAERSRTRNISQQFTSLLERGQQDEFEAAVRSDPQIKQRLEQGFEISEVKRGDSGFEVSFKIGESLRSLPLSEQRPIIEQQLRQTLRPDLSSRFVGQNIILASPDSPSINLPESFLLPFGETGPVIEPQLRRPKLDLFFEDVRAGVENEIEAFPMGSVEKSVAKSIVVDIFVGGFEAAAKGARGVKRLSQRQFEIQKEVLTTGDLTLEELNIINLRSGIRPQREGETLGGRFLKEGAMGIGESFKSDPIRTITTVGIASVSILRSGARQGFTRKGRARAALEKSLQSDLSLDIRSQFGLIKASRQSAGIGEIKTPLFEGTVPTTKITRSIEIIQPGDSPRFSIVRGISDAKDVRTFDIVFGSGQVKGTAQVGEFKILRDISPQGVGRFKVFKGDKLFLKRTIKNLRASELRSTLFFPEIQAQGSVSIIGETPRLSEVQRSIQRSDIIQAGPVRKGKVRTGSIFGRLNIERVSEVTKPGVRERGLPVFDLETGSLSQKVTNLEIQKSRIEFVDFPVPRDKFTFKLDNSGFARTSPPIIRTQEFVSLTARGVVRTREVSKLTPQNVNQRGFLEFQRKSFEGLSRDIKEFDFNFPGITGKKGQFQQALVRSQRTQVRTIKVQRQLPSRRQLDISLKTFSVESPLFSTKPLTVPVVKTSGRSTRLNLRTLSIVGLQLSSNQISLSQNRLNNVIQSRRQVNKPVLRSQQGQILSQSVQKTPLPIPRGDIGFGQNFKVNIPSTVPTGFIVPPILPTDRVKQKSSRKRKSGRGFGASPTLVAVSFDIRGKPIKRATGFELVRPLPVNIKPPKSIIGRGFFR